MSEPLAPYTTSPVTTPAVTTQPETRPSSAANSPSYFSSFPSHPDSRQRERGYTSYHPRRPPSLQARDQSAEPSRRPAGEGQPSWTASLSNSTLLSRRVVKDLDNWQILQDLVGADERDDGTRGRGTVSALPTPLLGRGVSHRSLRSFFTLPPDVPEVPTALRVPSPKIGTGTQTPVTGIFSSSPPEMDAPFGIEEGIEGTEELNDEDGEETSHGHDYTVPLIPVENENSQSQPKPTSPLSTNLWPPSPVSIAIFKCVVSYLIASLFTFVPALSALLSTSSEVDSHGRISKRPAYSAHMVATIVVYFNPAKTVGNMFLATRFCVVLAFLATIVSLLSMATLHLFDLFSPSQGSSWDWISEIGDWMVCILWIGGSMGSLAWAKVWVNNPSFNSGCSMAAVTIYTVVIKEGAIPKLLEVLLIVLIGAVITNLTCFLIFPQSATTRLQASISRSLTSFSTLLDLLTSTFLLEKNIVKDTHTTLKSAIKAHASAFKTLKTDLAEAKNERMIDSRIRGKKLELYDAAIGSLTRLAQHLAGLRGSTRLQEGLIRAAREGKLNLDLHTQKQDLSASFVQNLVVSPGPDLLYDMDISTSVKLFLQFRDIAGHEMDTLVSFCDDALDAVQAISEKESHHDLDVSSVRNGLASALRQFNQSSSIAIKRLYAGPRREKGVYSSDSSEEEDQGNPHERARENHGSPSDPHSLPDGPNETVFLIYFFLFTLEEFARELLFLLDTVSEILFADSISTMDYVKSLLPSKRNRKEKRAEYLYKQFRQVVPVDPSQLQPPLFPKNAREGRNTLQAPIPSGVSPLLTIRQRFWAFGDWLRTPQVRYAVKTGLGGAILAAPAYTEIGRPIFLEYRGEWALIAYFGAISPTVGQTNFLSFFRIVGTLAGAAIAVLFYTLFPENPVMLPILGVIFSIPCFYVITQMPDYAQAGRFTLLTYNLTCLYAYNSREKDVTPFSIAFHRSTSVIIGVIWAAIVSRYWWPFTARRELRMGLSDFCLDLSYLYSKLVTTYSRGVDPPDPNVEIAEDEEEPLLPVGSPRHPHLSPGVRQFMAMELHLQSQLGSLRDLLAQTRNEPRLKGPFAFEFYQEVLLSCERMLDRLHSMRCVTTRDEWDNGIRESFVVPVNKQRREMAGNVILYFYTLSAGFRLRTPMPPYLPPAERARQDLVQAIRSLDVVKRRSVRGGGRHLLFFAYALAMQEVIAELEYLGQMMQDAFGVISQSTVVDFERLFEATPRTMSIVAPGQVL